jgi:hypothetical protein
VVSKAGATLGIGRSFARSTVLLLPNFLNGAPIPLQKMGAAGSIILAVAVFGLGISIVYLIVFNARTRQSLHDLAVGSYVVRVGSETADKPRTWAGHHVVVGLIMLAVMVVPLVLAPLVENWLPKEMMAAFEAIQGQPEVIAAQVFAGQNFSWDAQGKRASTSVNVTVRVNRPIEDRDAEANKLMAILLEKFPDAGTKDAIVITLVEGYDLGIASWFRRYPYAYPPAQWRERISGTTPVPSPTP